MAAAQVLHDACPALITRAERRLIGADLARARTMLKNADEEPPCGGQVLLSDTSTSMTCPYWSIVRYR